MAHTPTPVGRLIPLLCCLLLVGCAPASCSHTAEINKAATNINRIATETRAAAQEIAISAASDSPDLPMIVDKSTRIAAAMSEVQAECRTIAIHAGNVEDSKSQWVTLVQYASVAIAIIGVCVLSWYWGAGELTRSIFKRLGWWVDPAEEKRKSELKLADEVRKGVTSPNELVAAMRADPQSNRLYSEIKKEK